jgi:lipopolysaccharide biosynthesis glycosyltransferase
MISKKTNSMNIYIGYDKRESIVFHTFLQSIFNNTNGVFSITPLISRILGEYVGVRTDGSNDFVYTRFLVPHLQEFNGWALYADGDMICQGDLLDLFSLANNKYAVMVVKHDYKTKQTMKYLGNKNENYPKKNWSSLILWNCNHVKNKVLTPDYIAQKDAKFLHRFEWLLEDEVGELPLDWNWLSVEYPVNANANIIHYTLGAPCFKEYRDTDMADIWLKYQKYVSNGFDVD